MPWRRNKTKTKQDFIELTTNRCSVTKQVCPKPTLLREEKASSWSQLIIWRVSLFFLLSLDSGILCTKYSCVICWQCRGCGSHWRWMIENSQSLCWQCRDCGSQYGGWLWIHSHCVGSAEAVVLMMVDDSGLAITVLLYKFLIFILNSDVWKRWEKL